MSRTPALADADTRATLVQLVKDGCTREAAARQLGLSGRTITRWIARHPEFEHELESARLDGRAIRHLHRLVHPPERRASEGGWKGGRPRTERRQRRQAEIARRLAELQRLARAAR